MPVKIKKADVKPAKQASTIDDHQSKILQIELTETFVTFRTQLTLLTQALTALLAGNIAYLGYAYSTKKALLVMFSASFPIIILAILNRVRKWMIPIIYSAIVIENGSIGNGMGVITNFISFIQSPKYVNQLLEINKITDLEKKRAALRKMALPMGDKGFTRIVCVLGAVGEIVFGVILWQVFHWSLF